jgi:hypothetical protein
MEKVERVEKGKKKSKINAGSLNLIVVDGRYCQLGEREKERDGEFSNYFRKLSSVFIPLLGNIIICAI